MPRCVQAREQPHRCLADLLARRVAERDDKVARSLGCDAARAEPAAAHNAGEQLEPVVAGLVLQASESVASAEVDLSPSWAA